MAVRPVYIPKQHPDPPGVIVKEVEFTWFPGMSKCQKQKSINSLHESATELGINSILEISSKSKDDLGVRLSAFNLMITTKKKNNSFSVEAAFQGSKVFEKGGPFTDLLEGTPKQAKKDIRLKESGNLVGFSFYGKEFPIKPKTLFYDWLYINALHQNKDISRKIISYKGFTDIEFNPKKSLNCQAYSAALFVSLSKNVLLDKAVDSLDQFNDVLCAEYTKRDSSLVVQGRLF